MGNIGPGELLIIARIADIGKGLGQGIKNFKEGLKEGDAEAKPNEAKALSSPAEKKEKEA
jgi:Sec-independent protein translocase protein TatA